MSAKAGIAPHYKLRAFLRSLDDPDGEQVHPASTPTVFDDLGEAARRREEVAPAAADD